MKHKHLSAALIIALTAAFGAFAQAKPVVAVISSDTPIYSNSAIDSTKTIGSFTRGEPLLIVSSQDKRVTADGVPTIWYQVKTSSGSSGWLPGSRLSFTATAFPRSAFQDEDQYIRYVTMAYRVGEKVTAVRSYEKVAKGDIGYLVDISEGVLPFAVVWEHNLEATPSASYLPKDFPKVLEPYVYFVNAGDIQLLGEAAATPIATLAKTIPAQYKTPDGYYSEEPDDDLAWYTPEGYSYGYGYDDYGYGDYDYGDYDYEDYEDYPEYVEGVETYGNFRVGSAVILGKHDDVGGGTNWTSAMNAYVGKTATITELLGADSFGFLVVKVTGNTYSWRVRNLKLKGHGEEGSYGFAVGDRVIIGAHRYIDDDNNWADEMMNYVGMEATITEMVGTDSDGTNCYTVHVDIDDGDWYWRVENMTPVK